MENKKQAETPPLMFRAASLGLIAAAELSGHLDTLVRHMRADKTEKDSKWTND